MSRAALALAILAFGCGEPDASEDAVGEAQAEGRLKARAAVQVDVAVPPEAIEFRRRKAVVEMAEAWDGGLCCAASFNALDPSASVTATSDAPAFDPLDDYWGLPEGYGREVVAGYCAACHSLRLVMQQRADAERWSELIAWMSEKQGMADLEPEDRARAVSYLAEHFGPGR
jgi:hypothetical protein